MDMNERYIYCSIENHFDNIIIATENNKYTMSGSNRNQVQAWL